MAIRQVFTSADATTTSTPIELKNTGHPATHVVTFMAEGTWDGATAYLQVGPTSAGPFIDFANNTITANSAANFEIGDGYFVRAVLIPVSASASTSVSVDAWIGVGRSTRG